MCLVSQRMQCVIGYTENAIFDNPALPLNCHRTSTPEKPAMPLKGALLGMGNPLLDVSSTVDQAFLDKYQVLITVAGGTPSSGRSRDYVCQLQCVFPSSC